MANGEKGTGRTRRGMAALTASIAIIGGGFAGSTPATASDQTWACQVMLCASNPGGWMQFAECVPPIQKLITHLALGGSFPVCIGGGVSSAKYTKAKNGRPATVLFTMTNGQRQTYTVPTQADVYAAQNQAQ